MRIAIAYIPVLHKGYINFLDSLQTDEIEELYLVGDLFLEEVEEFDYLNRKDRIRALSFNIIHSFAAEYLKLPVHELTPDIARGISAKVTSIRMLQDDVGRIIAERFFPDVSIAWYSSFVRWHPDNVGEDRVPEESRSLPLSELRQRIFNKIQEEGTKSSDWWRHVGAALVKNDQIIIASHNEHMPDPQTPNVFGDTRALFKKGVHINYVTSAHAEGAAIAEAARRGVSTEGAELYVTDFPCPYCARIIAKSGIKTVYFQKGYAVLAGDEFMKAEGIELVKLTQ